MAELGGGGVAGGDLVPGQAAGERGAVEEPVPAPAHRPGEHKVPTIISRVLIIPGEYLSRTSATQSEERTAALPQAG